MTGGPVVVDTSAVMAVLFAEVDALVYAQALESATRLRMAAPTWVESMQVVTARRGDLGQAGLAELLSRLGGQGRFGPVAGKTAVGAPSICQVPASGLKPEVARLPARQSAALPGRPRVLEREASWIKFPI